VFVGATDPALFELEGRLGEQLQARANAQGVGDRVSFVAPTNRIEDYYRAADLLVMPSLREGLPNVVLEAMACGLPVVASRLPGSTDTIIEDDVNGLLVPAGDGAAFAAAIDRVLSDGGLAARLGGAARRTAETRYDIRMVAGRWLDVYRELLGRR
jgi:glycosyltransferase involved in cell wall biosynthesis